MSIPPDDDLLFTNERMIKYLLSRPEVTFARGYAVYRNAYEYQVHHKARNLKYRCDCITHMRCQSNFDSIFYMLWKFYGPDMCHRISIPRWFYPCSESIVDVDTLNDPAARWKLANEDFGIEIAKSSDHTISVTYLGSGEQFLIEKDKYPIFDR